MQGVFFRDFTQRSASSLGLTGWVRNTENGAVEIMVEGEKDKIECLLGRIKEGPPLSRVDSVDKDWESFTGEYQDFRITW